MSPLPVLITDVRRRRRIEQKCFTPSTRDESLLASPATTNETSGTPNRASMQCDFEVSGGGASLIPLLTLSEVTSSLWEAQENDGDVMTWIVECKRRGSFPLCSTEQCVTFCLASN